MKPVFKRLRKRLAKGFVRLGYYSRPSFLIIGAQKAGTSALFSTLRQHPQLVAPERKELHFFDDGDIKYGDFPSYHNSFHLPPRLFPNKITFEASPSYLYHTECPKRIYEYSQDMLLIAILRDPIARAYSAWNMYRRFADPDNNDRRSLADYRSFEEAVRYEADTIEDTKWENNKIAYIKRGVYVEQIQRYLQYFPRKSLLILDYHDLLHTPEICLRQICNFLGVDDKVEFRVKRANVSSYESAISKGTADFLRTIYMPYNDRLFELLGREFKW